MLNQENTTTAPKGIARVFPPGSWGARSIIRFKEMRLPEESAMMFTLFTLAVRCGNFFYVQNLRGKVNPNIYLMALAETSGCKDVFINAVNDLLAPVPLIVREDRKEKNGLVVPITRVLPVNLHLGDEPTIAGMFDALLASHGCGYFEYSEYSDHLRMNKRNANNPESMFKKVFGYKPNWRPAKRMKPGLVVKFPAPSRLAATQFSRIVQDINIDNVRDGSMARNAFLEIPKEPLDSTIEFAREQDTESSTKNLRKELGRMFDFLLDEVSDEGPGGNYIGKVRGIRAGKRLEMKVTDGAAADYNDWRIATRTRLNQEYGDDIEMFCMKMTGEYPLKIAMSLAFGMQQKQDEYRLPNITKKVTEASLRVCNHIIDFSISLYNAAQGLQTNEVIVLQFLEKQTAPITYRRMKDHCEAIRKMPKAEFDTVIKTYTDTKIRVSVSGRTNKFEMIRE